MTTSFKVKHKRTGEIVDVWIEGIDGTYYVDSMRDEDDIPLTKRNEYIRIKD
jgi:hypothetical protein